MIARITVSRSTARLVLGGVVVLIIVVALVMWPHPKPAVQKWSSLVPVTITPVPGLPRGGAACDVLYRDLKPFNAGASGTPMTSCGFVEEVRRAYATTRTAISPTTSQVIAASPATHKEYKLVCFESVDYATCTGGQGAVIYLYNQK
jgi:hypothetical protein